MEPLPHMENTEGEKLLQQLCSAEYFGNSYKERHRKKHKDRPQGSQKLKLAQDLQCRDEYREMREKQRQKEAENFFEMMESMARISAMFAFKEKPKLCKMTPRNLKFRFKHVAKTKERRRI